MREKGINESATLIDTALTIMQNLEVEYTEIVSLETFENIDIIDEKALMLIAAKVNVNGSKVRLIDNIEL